MADFNVSGVFTLDDSNLISGIENAKTGFRSVGSNIQSAGVKITKFGVGASLALAPVTLFLKSSVSAFRDFDVAMTNSQTILGATNEEMEILSAQVLEIGANTGLGPQAVADSFFTVVSGVQDATTHMDILQASVTLAEAGLADLGVTTDGMVAVMNSYKFAAEDASFVSDVFTRTVQTGVGTMDEFVGALAPLASLANELSIDFSDLAASEAFLTTQGQSAGAAATELQAIMTAFIKPSQGMIDALDAMGVESGLALIETEGLQGAVDLLSDSLGDDALALGEVFTRAEALKGALILAGDGAEEFGTAFEGGLDGATQAAADLQNATDAAISDAFMAKLDVFKITLGESLSGAFRDVQEAALPFLDDMIQWAQDNPELTETILKVVGGVILFAGGLVILGPLVTAIGAGVGLLFSPFMLLAAAVGFAVFTLDAVAKAMGFEGITEALSSMVDQWTKNFEMLKTIIGEVVAIAIGLSDQLGNILDESAEIGGGLLEQTGTIVGEAGSIGGGLFSQAGTIAGQIFGFAGGGDFAAGQTMVVGEEGPEIVQFSQPGTVHPNGQSPGGGVSFDGATFIIHANDEAGGRAVARGIESELEIIFTRDG